MRRAMQPNNYLAVWTNDDPDKIWIEVDDCAIFISPEQVPWLKEQLDATFDEIKAKQAKVGYFYNTIK